MRFLEMLSLAAIGCGLLLSQPPAAPRPLAAPQMPADVIHEADVEYSNVGQRVAMDIVRPRAAATEPRPAVLMIHGGGFRTGNRQSYLPMAARLAQRGYVAATASYRLAPRHQFPAAIEDVKAAVRFLRANAGRLGIDPERICALGGSAGGHLALMLGFTAGIAEFEGSGPNREFASCIQCVVNYYGPSDFTQSYSKSVDAAQVLPQFLGGDLDHNRAIHQRASPLNWITPASSPVLSIHGNQDTYVAYEHSVWVTERLLAAGVPAELETIPGASHGFKGTDAERADQRAFEYLDRMLRPAKSQRTLLIADHGPNGQVAAMLWPSGKVLWTVPNERSHDVQPLPDGHVLYTLGAKRSVVEMDRNHVPVWTYSEGLEHALSAQRLPNGNTLIGDPEAGRVIEVTPDKHVVWKYENPMLAKMRMRNAYRTERGTTFIAVEAEGRVIEVNQAGEIVWNWQAPNGQNRRLYMARRLASGNAVMSLSEPGEIVEVDRAGKIVRSIAGANSDIKLGWASGFALLPDGGIVIADYTGRRLIEVDAKGKVLNELRTGSRTVASLAVVE